MLKFTFEDATTMHVGSTMQVITNKGPKQADAVVVGDYVRCGTVLYCRVDDIAAL